MNRLYCETVDTGAHLIVTDYDPFTADPCGLRIIQKNTKFGPVWAKLDTISREITRVMQHRTA